MVSVILLVHNGLGHVRTALCGLEGTREPAHEVIIVDNGSAADTRTFLEKYVSHRSWVKLIRSETNRYFAAGNNLGIAHAQGDSILLLNSDVVIKNPRWLSHLESIREDGIAGYGVVPIPDRPDGWCLLVRHDLCHLDETFPWFWSISKLSADACNAGERVVAVRNYAPHVHHVGGGSGPPPRFSREPPADFRLWWKGELPEVL